jgi:hypothetical protein
MAPDTHSDPNIKSEEISKISPRLRGRAVKFGIKFAASFMALSGYCVIVALVFRLTLLSLPFASFFFFLAAAGPGAPLLAFNSGDNHVIILWYLTASLPIAAIFSINTRRGILRVIKYLIIAAIWGASSVQMFYAFMGV